MRFPTTIIRMPPGAASAFVISAAALLTAVLSACAGLDGARLRLVPEGSTLVLHRPVEIPAGRFSVWIQDGRYGVNAVNEYKPVCRLRGESPAGGSVGPAALRIVAVDRERGRFGRRKRATVSMFRSPDGTDHIRFSTTLRFDPQAAAPLTALVCDRRDFARWGDHVSLREIREALGDGGTIRTPDPD